MIIVAIKKMSAGNDSVGEMWHETKVFDASTPIGEVVKWAGSKKDVILSVPESLLRCIGSDSMVECGTYASTESSGILGLVNTAGRGFRCANVFAGQLRGNEFRNLRPSATGLRRSW